VLCPSAHEYRAGRWICKREVCHASHSHCIYRHAHTLPNEHLFKMLSDQELSCPFFLFPHPKLRILLLFRHSVLARARKKKSSLAPVRHGSVGCTLLHKEQLAFSDLLLFLLFLLTPSSYSVLAGVLPHRKHTRK
jgi:hypothetical protein